MTTRDVHTPYWQGMIWLTIVGIGSGMFNSPNTAAMMGTAATPRRRGPLRRPPGARQILRLKDLLGLSLDALRDA